MISSNPYGFFILFPLMLWVAYTVFRAYRTGVIFSGGMYCYQRNERPFMYWMVFVIHVGIVAGFIGVLAGWI